MFRPGGSRQRKPRCGARARRGDSALPAPHPTPTQRCSHSSRLAPAPAARSLLLLPGAGLPLRESSTARKDACGCCCCCFCCKSARIIGLRVAVDSWLWIKMAKQYRVWNSCPNGDDGCGSRTLWWRCGSPCWYFDKINGSVLTRIWQRDNKQQGTWSCPAKLLSELQEFPYSLSFENPSFSLTRWNLTHILTWSDTIMIT